MLECEEKCRGISQVRLMDIHFATLFETEVMCGSISQGVYSGMFTQKIIEHVRKHLRFSKDWLLCIELVLEAEWEFSKQISNEIKI